MEIIRSLIFVPGNRINMIEKALDFNADIIMYDLEDSVPPDEKENARNIAKEWVPKLHAAGKKVMVRCNGFDTGLTKLEISAVVSPSLYGVSVGKTESEWDIKGIEQIINPLEQTCGKPWKPENYSMDRKCESHAERRFYCYSIRQSNRNRFWSRRLYE